MTMLRIVRFVLLLAGYGLLTQPAVNHRPVAVPGPSRSIVVPAGSDSLPTVLDGSSSFDPDGDPLAFSWIDTARHVIGTAAVLPVTLPLNSPQRYVLTVTDPAGASDSAVVQVTAVADVSPPVVEPPFDVTVGATDGTGTTSQDSTALASFLAAGTATDDLDTRPVRLPPQANGADVDDTRHFPIGTTEVTFRFEDFSGNVGTATARVTVAGLRDGDLFVGGATAINRTFGTLTEPGIHLVRDGAASKYCDSVYPYVPFETLVDREGRIVFFNVPTPNGSWVMFRCNGPGQPIEAIAQFATGATLLPNVPVAFPGERFLGSAAGGGVLSGLHLEVENVVTIQGAHAEVLKQENYVFSLATTTRTPQGAVVRKLLSYSPEHQKWTDTDFPEEVTATSRPPVGAFHGGAHYWVAGNAMYRSKAPLSIEATGTAGGLDFDLTLGLFGGTSVVYSGNGHAVIQDDVGLQDIDGGCTLFKDVTSLMPFNPSGTLSPIDFNAVAYDEFGGNGLILTSTYAASVGAVVGRVSELPFDKPGDPRNLFQNANIGCTPTEKIGVTKLLGFGASGETPPNCCYSINHLVSSPLGLISKDYARAQIQRIASGTDRNLPVVATLGYLPDIGGLTAWPVRASPGSTAAVVIQVNSPVDVLVTDASGRRLGVDPGTGQPVDDFAEDGFDSGPGEPRFFAIQNPAAGSYQLQLIGTGDGPFSVQIYRVNSERRIVPQATVTGTAAVGITERHDFSVEADGGVRFVDLNAAPTAVAGADQVVTADGTGQALVTLDGRQSFDPDGDALSFQWAGPSGLVSGGMTQVSLPIGEHSLLLTVDDGKGHNATAQVVVTVQPGVSGAVNATGSVSLAYGGFRYNPMTRRFVQIVTITNTSTSDIVGPVSLVLDDLSAGVSVYAPAGTTAATTPAGSPYVNVEVGSDNLLAPQESASVAVTFSDPARVPIRYTARVLAGGGVR